MPRPPAWVPQLDGDSRGTTPFTYPSRSTLLTAREVVVLAASVPSSASTWPRSQRRVPPSSQTWSISERSSVRTLSGSGVNVTGPATLDTSSCQPPGPPEQSVPTSTLYRLRPVLRARSAENDPGAALVWRWPCSWVAMTSTPSNFVSCTVMSPSGTVPIFVPP